MRTLAFMFAAVVGALVASLPAAADNRPAELPMFQMLNGEISRDTLSDGGGVVLATTDAGIGCASLVTGAVYELHCNANAHVCPFGDGGCSTSITSPAYGRPLAASSASSPAPYYLVLQPNPTAGATKLVCAMPAATASLTCAAFRLR